MVPHTRSVSGSPIMRRTKDECLPIIITISSCFNKDFRKVNRVLHRAGWHPQLHPIWVSQPGLPVSSRQHDDSECNRNEKGSPPLPFSGTFRKSCVNPPRLCRTREMRNVIFTPHLCAKWQEEYRWSNCNWPRCQSRDMCYGNAQVKLTMREHQIIQAHEQTPCLTQRVSNLLCSRNLD